MAHAPSLSVESRRFGDVIVVTCVGRVVAGDEAAVLERHVTSLLPDNSLIVLNWHDVNYIDSGGVGLVVRLLNRTRSARGDLKLCAVSERAREVLKITRLDKVFERPKPTPSPPFGDLLCRSTLRSESISTSFVSRKRRTSARTSARSCGRPAIVSSPSTTCRMP